jgi:hypothetical protein
MVSRGIAYQTKSDRKVIAINPRYGTAYLDRGTAYQAKGNYDQAAAGFILRDKRFGKVFIGRMT